MSNDVSEKTTFITGGTGFIGLELIKNILKNESYGIIYLLIRSNKEHTALRRFQELVKELIHTNDSDDGQNSLKRIQLVEGDITLERFGMELSHYENLAQKINRIYHVAASVHLTGRFDRMLRTNVGGTKTVLDFALKAQETGALDLVNYVSTAYVAGKRAGIILENELEKNQKFNNNYEEVKYKAEVLVRSYAKKIPITIYRPSIVMGHSSTGWTKTFNVLYEPMKMIYLGGLKFAPADHRTIVDIVPVDYVAKGIYHISTKKEKAISKTFHLTIGKGRSLSFPYVIKQLIESLFNWADYYQVENPKKAPILLNPKVFRYLAKLVYVLSNDQRKKIILKMLTYTDYVSVIKEFDATNAEEILKPMGIICPSIDEYLNTLCHYAVCTHFGKSDKPENVYLKNSKPSFFAKLKTSIL